MNYYDLIDRKDVINRIIEIDEKTNDVLSQENVDEKKLFKLRYQQMIQGLYLQK